jgi:hypothetical protein
VGAGESREVSEERYRVVCVGAEQNFPLGKGSGEGESEDAAHGGGGITGRPVRFKGRSVKRKRRGPASFSFVNDKLHKRDQMKFVRAKIRKLLFRLGEQISL